MNDDPKIQVSLSPRAITHIVIALQEYEERLRESAGDSGPIMDDAMFVHWLRGEVEAARPSER